MRVLLAPRLACLLSFGTRDPAFAWSLSSLGEIRNFTRASPRPGSVAKPRLRYRMSWHDSAAIRIRACLPCYVERWWLYVRHHPELRASWMENGTHAGRMRNSEMKIISESPICFLRAYINQLSSFFIPHSSWQIISALSRFPFFHSGEFHLLRRKERIGCSLSP